MVGIFCFSDPKFQLLIFTKQKGVNGDAKLLEAIDFSYNGLDLEQSHVLLVGEQSAAIKITATMREDAGNEYQDLSISGISLTAKATQHSHEKDSTDDQYDKGALDNLLQERYIEYLINQGYVQLSATSLIS